MGEAKRFEWVDYAKGICIVAVVMFYATGDIQRELVRLGWRPDQVSSWMDVWIDFARPFRMPDFFLLSGLFLSRVIDRPWREYLDKKVVHYLYFFVLWTVIFFLARLALGLDWTTGWGAATSFATMLVQPFAMLWFIQMLAIYFMVTRLTRRVPRWLMLALAAGLQVANFTSEWVQLRHFGERYVYFYVGYAFAPWFFRVADWARDNHRRALTCLVLWAALNQWLVAEGLSERAGPSLLLGLAGATAVIAVASLLSKFSFMNWLRYLGEHSIVTYLGFYLPMSMLTLTFARHSSSLDIGLASAVISAVSIVVALSIFWATRLTVARYLFVRPRWACLTTPKERVARSPYAGSSSTEPS
jgi:uncharacterized membrane protein YcfT